MGQLRYRKTFSSQIGHHFLDVLSILVDWSPESFKILISTKFWIHIITLGNIWLRFTTIRIAMVNVMAVEHFLVDHI